jgi:hypothetical protein
MMSYGVNVTPPSPISYNLSTNLGDITSIMRQVNTAQNQANSANNQRYTQLLGVLNNAASGQQGLYGQALGSLNAGYGNAVGSLNNSLANNQTVFNNELNRVGQQAKQAGAAAQQSAISRGLGNTTITNALQDQVTRSANDAYSNIAAQKASMDNNVYANIANLYSNQGSAAANLQSNQANAYMNGGTTIAGAIQSRTDQGPDLSQYAQLIQAAQAAKASSNKSTITTYRPDPGPNSVLGPGGSAGGGGLSGGIAASMGGGGFNSGGGSGGGARFYGPGYGSNDMSPTVGGGFSSGGGPGGAAGEISGALSGQAGPAQPGGPGAEDAERSPTGREDLRPSPANTAPSDASSSAGGLGIELAADGKPTWRGVMSVAGNPAKFAQALALFNSRYGSA